MVSRDSKLPSTRILGLSWWTDASEFSHLGVQLRLVTCWLALTPILAPCHFHYPGKLRAEAWTKIWSKSIAVTYSPNRRASVGWQRGLVWIRRAPGSRFPIFS